jgi:hypothetical protein
LAEVICDGIGIRDKSGLADDFVKWLENNYRPGVLGTPLDMSNRAGETGLMLTDLTPNDALRTKNREREVRGPKTGCVMETQPRGRGCR